MTRNQIYPLKELKEGDRFHYVGQKNKRGEVCCQVYEENAQPGALPIKTEVLLDGKQFKSHLSPEKEVVYLRSKEN